MQLGSVNRYCVQAFSNLAASASRRRPSRRESNPMLDNTPQAADEKSLVEQQQEEHI